MKHLLKLVALLPLFAQAQTEEGIRFDADHSWAQIKEIAIREHKYIFLDCYASWCGPCKQMDQDVYASGKLGEYINSRFISIKIQFDSTGHDDASVRERYSDARHIMKEYHVSAFPTFLFFTPDGQFVHRDLSYKSEEEFLQLAQDAQDPSRQYCTQVRNYMNGQRDYARMDSLAEMAQSIGDTMMARKLAIDFTENYLMKLDDQQLYTIENMQKVVIFYKLLSTKGRFFSLFYPDGSRADSVMGQPGFAQGVADAMIEDEMVNPYIARAKAGDGKLDWSNILRSIARKYNNLYADRVVTKGQLHWYGYVTKTYDRNWTEYIDCYLYNVRHYETDTNKLMDLIHNNFAFEIILKHSDEKAELTATKVMMEGIVRRDPANSNNMDTYANILFKLGERDTALRVERKALDLSPKNELIQQNYEKMEKGQPTWL